MGWSGGPGAQHLSRREAPGVAPGPEGGHRRERTGHSYGVKRTAVQLRAGQMQEGLLDAGGMRGGVGGRVGAG